MRFVLAIVSFVLAALAIGLGVAQRTVLALPDSVSSNATISSAAPITVIPGETLNAHPRSQSVTITGDGPIFAAYGRTTDVESWIGDASHNTLAFDAETGKMTGELTEGSPTVPSAAGSDLWLQDYSNENQLSLTIKVPENVSLLIMSDGTAAAPSDVSITWPVDNSTPWATPLVIAGGGLLLLGLALLFWAVTNMRSARGPRRKQQKMPKLPRQPRYKPSRVRPKALESPKKGRRSIRPNLVAVIPLTLVSTLVLGGCSADFWAGRNVEASAPVPSASATDSDVVAPKTPAVTEAQAKRIVARIAAIVTQADTDADKSLAATRLAGPALELRLANYKMRKADKSIKALSAIPSGDVKITLPAQNDGWPRQVFVAIKPTDETVPSTALVMIQQSPREQYLVHYAITLEPGAVIPPVALASVGTTSLLPDSPFLVLPPGQIALAYADILTVDAKSEYFEQFAEEGDSLRVDVGLEAKTKRKKKIPSTARLTFSNEVGEGQAVAFSTNDTGALVAVNLNEIETIRVVEAGAAVNAPKQVKALLGKSLSTKGLNAIYGDQLLFYVPPVGSSDKIVLLGYSQGIVSASEYKKKK